MVKKNKIIPLWDSVGKQFKNFDLYNFREIGQINERLGTWGPISNNTRYYKSLMYEFCYYLDNDKIVNQDENLPRIKDIYKNINNQNVGNPICIEYEGMTLSMDYILSIEEIKFLHSHLCTKKVIAEIGAGFGRTSHAIISNFDIEKYYIIDLPVMLELSKAFLKHVLNKEQYSKLNFLTPDAISDLQNIDLVINVDSMQEMTKESATEYLEWISVNSGSFFSKNAMGKYDPAEIGLKIENKAQYDSALNMGLMQENFSLFNSIARKDAVEQYHSVFCPAEFALTKHQRGFGQYLSYQLALYNKRPGK